MSGGSHPLPDSAEARHDEIPEAVERAKGRGDDPAEPIQPAARPVNPDGEPYSAAPGRDGETPDREGE